MRRMPFAAFAHNQAWLEVSLAAQALLRWTALLCLEGKLALAEPKRVRQLLLHVAGRIVRSARRTILRLPRSWLWAEALAGPSRGCGRCPPLGGPVCSECFAKPKRKGEWTARNGPGAVA